MLDFGSCNWIVLWLEIGLVLWLEIGLVMSLLLWLRVFGMMQVERKEAVKPRARQKMTVHCKPARLFNTFTA